MPHSSHLPDRWKEVEWDYGACLWTGIWVRIQVTAGAAPVSLPPPALGNQRPWYVWVTGHIKGHLSRVKKAWEWDFLLTNNPPATWNRIGDK